MKPSLAASLRIALVLVAVAALVFLLGEPHLEGRNANSTLFEVYFKDPFLAYVYVASIPFFLGLRQAFKLCSEATVARLRTLKQCALALTVFVAATFFMPVGDPDDRPQGIVLRLVVLLPSLLVAVAAAKFERDRSGCKPG